MYSGATKMNPYQIHVNCDARIGQFIMGLAYQSGQGVGTWILHEILVHHKDEAIKHLGQEEYDRLLTRYSDSLAHQLAKKNKDNDEKSKSGD